MHDEQASRDGFCSDWGFSLCDETIWKALSLRQRVEEQWRMRAPRPGGTPRAVALSSQSSPFMYALFETKEFRQYESISIAN
jgi:hypothetical protein